jgi:hypothetical protein
MAITTSPITAYRDGTPVQSTHGRGRVVRSQKHHPTSDILYAVRMNDGKATRYLWGKELTIVRSAIAAAALVLALALGAAVPVRADPNWGPDNPPPIPGSEMAKDWPCGWSFGPVTLQQGTVRTWRWKPCN